MVVLNEGKYYYIKRWRNRKKKKILEINGAYYAFKADGVMVDASDNKYEGNEFYFTDESGKYIYCRAKKMEVYIHHYGFRDDLEIGNIIVRMDIEQ